MKTIVAHVVNILEKLKITKTTKQEITNETSPWLMAEQEEKENKN